MRKLLFAVLLVLAIPAATILIAPYTFLPGILESTIAGNIQSSLGLSREPEVDLMSDPKLGMLSGEFDEGTVVMDDYEIGDGVLADRVTLDLEPFDVNVQNSVTSGKLETENPLSGKMKAEISEKDVLEIARARVEDFPVNDVQLEDGRALVDSEVTVLGFVAPVSVEGGLNARNNVMVFTPERVEAFGVPLPDDVTQSLLGGTDFEYPLTGLPQDTTVTNLEVKRDRMTLFGDVERVALG